MKDEEFQEEHYDEEEVQGEEGSSDFGPFLQQQLQYMPWWLISIVVHTIILCLTVLVVIEKPPQTVAIEIETKLETQPEELKPEPKKPDLLQETKPVEQNEPDIKDPVMKEAKVSERNETANQENFNMSKGKLDAYSDSPLQGKFDKSEIGIGSRAGGPFGNRLDQGGKENLKKLGLSKKTEEAVQMGLLWLKRHQNENDGRWDADGFLGLCGKDSNYPGSCGEGQGDSWCDAGITGLALLCFLGAGNTTSLGEFRDQVEKGVRFLKNIQEEDGCIGRQGGQMMYNHAIATLAMAEAYALSNYNPLLKTSTEKAVKFLVEAQNPNMGWRYTPRCGDNDTSVTGWCVMALKSAKIGGVEVPDKSFEGAKAFLDFVTDTTYYRAGYTQKNEYVAPQKGFTTNEALTAVAITSRVFMCPEDKKDSFRNDPRLINGAGLLREYPPSWGNNEKGENQRDYYYWYYGTLAMYQMGGEFWLGWNDKMKEALLNTQETSGCKTGSWPPNDRWSAAGGRIYATALNVLSLEIYYRYDKVFK